MADQPTIKGWLETLAASMKASEMSDEDWADAMATIIYNAITARTTTVTGVTIGAGTAAGSVDA